MRSGITHPPCSATHIHIMAMGVGGGSDDKDGMARLGSDGTCRRANTHERTHRATTLMDLTYRMGWLVLG